jgi:serine/threonine protein kinase
MYIVYRIMSGKNNVIGEGTYGCIHKDSLKCKDDIIINGKVFDYTDMVSKIMEDSDVKKELDEYKKVSAIDKKSEFYLGKIKPFGCKPAKTDKTMNAIKECKSGRKFIRRMERKDDMSLIIMQYGGMTLEKFATSFNKFPKTPTMTKYMESFWLEAHRLFRGIKLFVENGFIHHDIKPQNIVYNISNNRLNFIDFGLVQDKQEIIRDSKKDDYFMAIQHWSLPIEMQLYNKSLFDKCVNKPKGQVMEKYIKDSIVTLSEISKYIYIKKSPLSRDYLENMDGDINNQINNYILKVDYDTFINKSIDTIDIYGVGFTLLYVLLETSHLISKDLAEDLYNLFFDMVTPDLSIRYSIDDALDSYEDILETHGIPKRYGKVMSTNHTYVDVSDNKKKHSSASFTQSIKKGGDMNNTRKKRTIL